MIGLAIAVAVAVAYAWWATGLRPFTLPSLVAVLAGGLVAMALGATRLPPRAPPAKRPGTAVWAGLGGALAAWQLGAFLRQPRSEHPTLSSLANTLFESHPARAVAFLAWLAAAATLARR